MRRLTGAAGLVALALCGACAEPADEADRCAAPQLPVADPTAWRVVVDDADDPWGGHAARCAPQQHRTEVQGDTRWHEIETRGCSAATLYQTVRETVCADDPVTMDVWHFPITEGDGDWTLAFGVTDASGAFTELASFGVPLPGAATTYTATFAPGRRLVPGDTVYLRLANHGTNTWNLYALETLDGAP